MGYEFVPRYKEIIGISNALQAVVTCSENHDFSDGEIVSFRVSRPYGMVEINNKQAKVLSHTDDTITVDVDTNTWSPFVYPASSNPQSVAVVVPSASSIIPGSYPATVNLEDAFDNIRT